MESLGRSIEGKTADGITVVTQADQEVPLELLLEHGVKFRCLMKDCVLFSNSLFVRECNFEAAWQ